MCVNQRDVFTKQMPGEDFWKARWRERPQMPLFPRKHVGARSQKCLLSKPFTCLFLRILLFTFI